ncbi:MAG: hypothetical protein ACHQ1D_00360 [Nitrososphaerales archaeon]
MLDLDLSPLAQFEEFIQEYSTISPQIKPNNRIEEILNWNYLELDALNSEECLGAAFELGAHCMFLQRELNENNARLNWCHDSLNWVISKDYTQYDPYMRFEVKRQAIIRGNSFAEKVELLRNRLQGRVTILTDKLGDLRKMVNLLEDLSKRKAYK